MHSHLVFIVFTLALLLRGTAATGASEQRVADFIHRYNELLDGCGDSDDVPCIVMRMDNCGVPDDFKSWHDYNAALDICICSKAQFESETEFIDCRRAKGFHSLSIPVPVSNDFIQNEQRKGEKFTRHTEYGTVADWHSPWFVLTRAQTKTLFGLLTSSPHEKQESLSSQ